ncbi:hypothetical protein RHS02_07598, partial [Rhizoctonia solani]
MDPPSAMPPNSPTHTDEQSRCWITTPEINISHVKANPECKVSGQIFVDEDVVCSLPWIESTVPLKWSGLLPWSAPLSSEITLRVCRSVKDKSRHYYFPPFSIPDVDETGELTLALSEARWSATIKFLTLKAAEHLFPSTLEKLSLLEDEREAPSPEAAEKGLFNRARGNIFGKRTDIPTLHNDPDEYPENADTWLDEIEREEASPLGDIFELADLVNLDSPEIENSLSDKVPESLRTTESARNERSGATQPPLSNSGDPEEVDWSFT